MQSIDSIEIYVYATKVDEIREKEDIKCSNTIK